MGDKVQTFWPQECQANRTRRGGGGGGAGKGVKTMDSGKGVGG